MRWRNPWWEKVVASAFLLGCVLGGSLILGQPGVLLGGIVGTFAVAYALAASEPPPDE